MPTDMAHTVITIDWTAIAAWIVVGLVAIISIFIGLTYKDLKNSDAKFDVKIEKTAVAFGGQLKEAITQVGGQFEKVETTIKTMGEKMDKTFEKVGEAITNLNTTVQKIQTSSETFNTNTTQRLNEHHEEFLRTRDRLHDLETWMTETEAVKAVEIKKKNRGK